MKCITTFSVALLGIAAIAMARADLKLPDVSQLAVNQQQIGLTVVGNPAATVITKLKIATAKAAIANPLSRVSESESNS